MADKIWFGMVAVSVVVAIFTGRMEEVSQAITEGAASAVTLCITIVGTMCFWRGLMEVMRTNGCAQALRRMLRPIVRRLFGMVHLKQSEREAAQEAICANMTANMMGLGNAATPFGIEAAKRLHDGSDTASDDLCTLVVLNSASIQLIPSAVAAIRAGLGSGTPYDILPAVWITSGVSVLLGLLSAKLAAGKGKKQ